MTTKTSARLAVREDEQIEDAELADWRALSLMSLWEVWDNDADAVYDSL